MRIDVLTTFPELFTHAPPGLLGVSIPKRAIESGRLEVAATDIRAFADPPHFKTDDRPYGGGPGMVMLAEPIRRAVAHAEAEDARPATRVLLTPQGEPLTQATVEELAALPRLLLLCGRYEGVDERVIERLRPRELSVGDYVLSGGEPAALVLIDALARLLPGVLGDAESSAQDSFGPPPATNPNGEPADARAIASLLGSLGVDPARARRLLDCPHYTRPREWDGSPVPGVLLSGDHDAVLAWRVARMIERTRARRPDLLGDG